PALVIHGHFYQPPRENPWTGEIEAEPSAHPFLNWNERIFQECYRPNSSAEILDEAGKVLKTVNNYAGISFNVGPTLFSWLERFHPETYSKILEADHISTQRCGGHGNAIAQSYVHAILPLCSDCDRRTLMRWSIAEFKHRFGRAPESLWLPETGCNDDTLGALIDEGLKFAILSPSQAAVVKKVPAPSPRKLEAPPSGSPGAPAPGKFPASERQDVSNGKIDSSTPYKFLHPDGTGRSIAIFFYNEVVSKAIAFEGVLISSQALLDRFEAQLGASGSMVSAAVDGESFGHHFRYGERGLAYALEEDAPKRGFWITNYAEYLEHHPPEIEVEIKKGPDGKGTAWSCPHGLGRWYADCGCQVGGKGGWNQAWRGPLREALDLLRDKAALFFQESGLFADPWKARDEHIGVILNPKTQNKFLEEQLKINSGERERAKAITHLDLQKNALLMYSSCGWFFADIAGLESILILKFAGRVLDYFDDLGLNSPRKEFLEILAQAKSNRTEMGNGADIFRRFAKPLRKKAAG
ncbi:MAG: DUF3536 domain-containing protein, partial [candidate division Zixibacteria bacterium]|nr:DUF3536 domain-containing protein [candidate division Zixibacteria bacterium]